MIEISTANALAPMGQSNDEGSPTSLPNVTLAPGVRFVDGVPMYSAAWIDFDDAPTSATH